MMHILRRALIDLIRGIRGWHRAAPLRTWLCLLAFGVSFGYALIYRIEPSVDARRYNNVAIHLATISTYCETCDVPLAKDTAIHGVGPGYQFFLAAIYKTFGVHYWIVWLIQALMHAIVVAWIWALLELMLAGAKTSRWTYALPLGLYAVHPDIVQGNAMLMTDGLFTLLFVGAIRILLPYILEAHPPNGWKRPVALGIVVGLLTMVRPTGLPFFLAILLIFAWRRLWKAAIITACCFVAVQTPWAIRNARTYDHFIYNSVVGGLDVWVGLYPKGPGEFNMDKLPEIAQRIEGLSADEVERVSMVEAKKIIREQPLFVLERTTQKFFKLFALTKTSAFWSHYHGTVDWAVTLILSIAFNAVLLGLGFAAMVQAILKRCFGSRLPYVAVAAIALMAISPTLTVVVNRYRIPMLPFFTLLSAFWLANTRGRERWPSLVGAACFLLLTTGVDLWGSWDKVIERIGRFRSS